MVILSVSSFTIWFYPYSGIATLVDGMTIFVVTGSGIMWAFSIEGLLIFLGAIFILNSRDDI